MNEISFIVTGGELGALVLLSYWLYLPSDLRPLLAGLQDNTMFALWCITSCISTAAFIVFFIELIRFNDGGDAWYDTTYWPFTAFLASAAMYMPLATRKWYAATIIALAITAASTAGMLACSVQLNGWNTQSWLLAVLCFHCTVVDLVYWGWTWSYGSAS